MRDDTPSLYAAIGITLPIATLALLARLYARKITKAGFWWDDGLAVLGYLGTTGYTMVALIWTVSYGLGVPLSEGPKNMTDEEKIRQGWLMLWCSSMTYTFGIAFCKFSLLVFYWRVFQISGIRIPIQVLFGLTVAWFLLRVFMVTLQCIPINALWDKSIKDANCSINESTFFFSTVLTHVLIDCAILILPVIEVRKLQLPMGQKLAVVGLFTLGFMTCITSALVLVESLKFDSHSPEVGLQMGLHTAWAAAEVNLAAISASLPMLRPIFRKLIPGSFLGSYGTGHGTGRTTQNHTHLSKSMKLSTIRTRNRDVEGSSTHELADHEGGSSDFNKAYNPDWNQGPRVVISSSKSKYASSKDSDDYDQGIYVRNEMVVQHEQV